MADIEPITVSTQSRKRKRKIWSCALCRRRKLQCDRGQPACQRCIKSGQTTSCSYVEHDDRSIQSSVFNKDPERPSMKKSGEFYAMHIDSQEQRIKELEAALACSTANHCFNAQHLPPTPRSLLQAEQSTNDTSARSVMFLRGGSFHTRFNGSTHPGAIIAQIDGLSQFTRKSFRKFPALEQARHDSRQSKFRRGEDFIAPRTVIDLIEILPTRSTADKMLEAYFSNFDGLYHVIHKEPFEAQYRDLWTESNGSAPSFIILSLLLIAVGFCLASITPGMHTTEGFDLREQATKIIRSCEYWLDTHTQEFDNVTDFQVAFTYVFAKQLDARRYKRTWSNCGTMLRNFMCAGLHKDPDRLKGITSTFDKEMRIRLWAAAAEFELQASFEKGMPAMNWTSQGDVPGPSNVSDDLLEEDSSAQPRHVYTTSSFLAIAGESLHFRHQLACLLNDVHLQLTFNQVKEYTDRLEEYLSAVPTWLDPQGSRTTALLSLNLLQYKLALQERQLRFTHSVAERQFSQMVMMDAATRMLDVHQSLISRGNLALEFLCGDHVRAALAICLVATSMDLQTGNSLLAKLIVREAPLNMEKAIAMIKEKAIRFGDDQRQLWIPVTAESFMKAHENPEDGDRYMQKAVEKFLEPMNVSWDSSQTANAAVTGDIDSNILAIDPNTLGPNFQSLDDIAAWTFEDWDPLSCLE